MTLASGGPRRLPIGLRPFGHRNFRLFWFGQLISMVGTWMQQVAQGWLVLQLTNDAFALGMVAAAQFVPVMFLGLFGGLAADVLPKRSGLLITQGASMVLALVLGLLVAAGHVEVWHVLVLAGLLGVVNAFDMPIRQSFAIEMVGRDDIAGAVALNSALFNGARIIGPAVAGLLIAAIGLAPCFLLNAASYLAVIGGLLAMRVNELVTPIRPPMERSWHAIGAQLGEGLRYVRATPVILLAVVVVGIVSTAGLNFQVLIPLAARDLLGGGAETYGFLMAASGIGSLVSALSLSLGRRPTLGWILAGTAAIGASITGLAFARSMPLALGLMLAAGWGLIAMAATTNTIIQLTVPDLLRGRVMSVYTTVFAGSTPVGGLLAGAIAAGAGVAAALVVGGVLSLLATLGAVVWVIRSGQVAFSTSPIAQLGGDTRPTDVSRGGR